MPLFTIWKCFFYSMWMSGYCQKKSRLTFFPQKMQDWVKSILIDFDFDPVAVVNAFFR